MAAPAQPVRVQDLQTKLEKFREKIADTKQRIEDVTNAPPPRVVAEQRMRQHLDSLADRAVISGVAYTATSEDYRSPELLPDVHTFGHVASMEPVIALLLRLPPVRAAVETELMKAIDAAYVDGDGPSEAERAVTLKGLRENLQKAELDEERIVRTMLDEGIYVARRADASAEALLSA